MVSEFAIKLRVLEPGQPNGLYHSENQQEAFLVLSGECRLLVEGEERLLRPWDFFHCPPWTEHIFVGAGDEPCVILMAGTRTPDEQLLYPVSELAARYGASVEEETTDFEAHPLAGSRHHVGSAPRTGTSFPGPSSPCRTRRGGTRCAGLKLRRTSAGAPEPFCSLRTSLQY